MPTKTKARKAAAGVEPKAERPTMPHGYGIAKGSKDQMAWSDVERQLAKAKNYWVGTTRPDGRPHAMPVWGLWLDGVFYFSSEGGSRKARNIAANPQVVVHLESGDDVVIIEGTAERIADRALFAKVDAAYRRSLGWGWAGFLAMSASLQFGPRWSLPGVSAIFPRAPPSGGLDLQSEPTAWQFPECAIDVFKVVGVLRLGRSPSLRMTAVSKKAHRTNRCAFTLPARV
jgi:hypothetical protein